MNKKTFYSVLVLSIGVIFLCFVVIAGRSKLLVGGDNPGAEDEVVTHSAVEPQTKASIETTLQGEPTVEQHKTEVEESLPPVLEDPKDAFNWLYVYLSNKKDRLVTEGEYMTIKDNMQGKRGNIADLLNNTDTNPFIESDTQSAFLEAYYKDLLEHKESDWLDKATKNYFTMTERVKVREGLDIEKVITDLDNGMTVTEIPPNTEDLMYGLIAYHEGMLEAMPFYDAACIMYRLDNWSKQHPETDEIFNKLKGKYNGILGG